MSQINRPDGQLKVFTAPTRHFFTDVVAEAMRLSGQGQRVLFVQFMKGGIGQGVEQPGRVANMDWYRCGHDGCIDTANPDVVQPIVALWDYVKQAIAADRYQLILLEDITLAISTGLLDHDAVVDCLSHRPPHIDITIMGVEDSVSEQVMAIADQITALREKALV